MTGPRAWYSGLKKLNTPGLWNTCWPIFCIISVNSGSRPSYAIKCDRARFAVEEHGVHGSGKTAVRIRVADPIIDAGAERISDRLGVPGGGVGRHHPLDQPVRDEGRRILVPHQVVQQRLRFVHHISLERRAERHKMGRIAQRVATHLHTRLLVGKEGGGTVDGYLKDAPLVELAGRVGVNVHLHRRPRSNARCGDAQLVELPAKVAWARCANSQRRLDLRCSGQHRCLREDSRRGHANL
eukprot:4526202-Prymnesium_polylepis.4